MAKQISKGNFIWRNEMKCVVNLLVSFRRLRAYINWSTTTTKQIWSRRDKPTTNRWILQYFYTLHVLILYYLSIYFLINILQCFLFEGGQHESRSLRSEDIPGSTLDLTRLSSFRVEQLKFWLSCRGDSLKNLPTKSVCIQRYITISYLLTLQRSRRFNIW